MGLVTGSGETPKSPFDTATEEIRRVVKLIEQLVTAGCQIRDGFLACTLTLAETQSDGIPHRQLFDAMTDLTDASLSFRRGALSFDLRWAHSQFQFIGDPSGDPNTEFEGSELVRARRAWDGNPTEASRLTGFWKGTIAVDLAWPLTQADSSRSWRVLRTLPGVVHEMSDYSWWTARDLFADPNGGPVVVGIATDEGVELLTARFGVASLDRIVAGSSLTPPGVASRLQAVAGVVTEVPHRMPLPEELEPLGEPRNAQILIEALRPWSDACAWAWMSNSTTVLEDGVTSNLEYFGYRRRQFRLPKTGYVGAAGQHAYALYEWATSDVSADRILSVRQVISLYDGTELPDSPMDVVRAAEPLYLALRTDRVTAALDTQRQARAGAAEAAQQSASAAQAAAKSTAERTIASLAAVVGIAVAHASDILARGSARALAIGVAALFAFLMAWTIVAEGLSMRAPINSFKKDLKVMTPLLGDGDREAIKNMDVLKTAKHAVTRMRILPPAVYGIGAIVSLSVAHYAFGLWPSLL
jgi:hypothetical protein